MISIVIITCNRLALLKRCMENVVSRTTDMVKEVIIWNNGSTDGTKEYLDALTDPRFRVIHHPKNIGTNARKEVAALTGGEYLITLDDDVIEAPLQWDKMLLDAFNALPDAGYVAAGIIDDGHGTHAEYMFRQKEIHKIPVENINGINILPRYTGAWCALTSKKLYDEVGGYRANRKYVFWNEDTDFVSRLKEKGYRNYLLMDMQVFHAAGPYYSEDKDIQKAKKKYYSDLFQSKKYLKPIKSVIKRFYSLASTSM